MRKNCSKEKELNKYLYERIKKIESNLPCLNCRYYIPVDNKLTCTYRDNHPCVSEPKHIHEIIKERDKEISQNLKELKNEKRIC